ncbi:unnamed protein product [Polarella glacialis]|uniref:Uncharacterized protein n=1 Tax=Polarella glacialis TaxID=89957 RepID=A0A813GXU4_POLGL|nr:unnamed protein product [Polarella glacialis]
MALAVVMLVALALPLPGRAAQQQEQRQQQQQEQQQQHPPLTVDRQFELAECVINVDQAALYIAQAGLTIYAADSDCSPDNLHAPGANNTERACAADILNVLTSFGWTATYLATAASECAETVSSLATCAADVTWLVTSFSEIATASASIAVDCVKDEASLDRAAERRLIAGVSESLTAEDRKVDIASCVVDVNMAAGYLVRASKQIHDGVKDCPKGDTQGCFVDVNNVISSFAWVIQFLTYAASDCGESALQDAACAGDIADLVAGVTSLNAAAMSLTNGCYPDAQMELP